MIKTVTWGWEPPIYEKIGKKKIRIFFHSEQQIDLIERENQETGEVEKEEVISYLCKTIEIEDQELVSMINKNPESFICQKRLLQERIKAYDMSEFVNSFSISGKNLWLDKATRVGLRLRFDSEVDLGKEITTLWTDKFSISLPLTGQISAKLILSLIENYASECYDNTQRHLQLIEELKTTEELKSYDYTVGYPDKLVF